MCEARHTHLAATEHCRALQRCNDDGRRRSWLSETCLTSETPADVLDLFVVHLKSPLLRAESGRDKRQEEAAGSLPPKLELQLRKQPSMDEGVRLDCKLCLTHCLTLFLILFTLVSLPVCCSFGMHTSHPFTVCITRESSYLVMFLHCTLSTAIRAVDDNQIDCLFSELSCLYRKPPSHEQRPSPSLSNYHHANYSSSQPRLQSRYCKHGKLGPSN